MTYPGTLLKNSNLFAKKELGQNFLADPKTAEHIVNLAKISKDDVVLEIGAGLGALTVHAAKRAAEVYAVERDDRIINILDKELKSAGVDNNVTLIHKDIFKVGIQEIAQNSTNHVNVHETELDSKTNTINHKNVKKIIVIGNLPYNISSQVLFMLVEKRTFISKAVLMFQKELAQRIAAPPGSRDYGRISAVMQYCSTIKTLTDVSANCFFPKPDVESRVIEVLFSAADDAYLKTSNADAYHFDAHLSYDQENFLFQVIKAAFSKRRKTLRNSISSSELGINKILTEKALAISGIDPERRAETLSVKEFIILAESLKNILEM